MGKARTLNSHLIINALIHIDIRSMILLGFSSHHGAKVAIKEALHYFGLPFTVNTSARFFDFLF